MWHANKQDYQIHGNTILQKMPIQNDIAIVHPNNDLILSETYLAKAVQKTVSRKP